MHPGLGSTSKGEGGGAMLNLLKNGAFVGYELGKVVVVPPQLSQSWGH